MIDKKKFIKKKIVSKCPVCKKYPTERFAPFCSKKCSDIDLINWLSDLNYESYTENNKTYHWNHLKKNNLLKIASKQFIRFYFAQVAQLVEQGTENPCVGGSIPPLGTI